MGKTLCYQSYLYVFVDQYLESWLLVVMFSALVPYGFLWCEVKEAQH